MTNVIADVAGQYKALVQLIHKMPEGDFVFLGDLVDRGPDSKRVLDLVMKNNYQCVLGNHEHMMLDYMTRGRFYGGDTWLWNGGTATLRSFEPDLAPHATQIPEKYLKWLANLPKYLEIDNCLISHAFARRFSNVEDYLQDACEFGRSIWDKDETTIIWNRGEPTRDDRWRLQVCGHNSQFGLREWADEDGTYAICLDDSAKKVLTGMVLETGEIFQQEYIP